MARVLATEFLCHSEPCLAGFNRSKMHCFAEPYPGCRPDSPCGRLVRFFLLQPARRTSAWGPTLRQVLRFRRMVRPRSLNKAGQTHTPRRQSELLTQKWACFGLEWWGLTRAQQAYLAPKRFWCSAPPAQKAGVLWGYFFLAQLEGWARPFLCGWIASSHAFLGRCARGPPNQSLSPLPSVPSVLRHPRASTDET